MVDVEIYAHAHDHGIPDDDIRHAIRLSTKDVDLQTDPPRWFIIGPDRAGNLLEVLVVETDDAPLAIHAQRLTTANRKRYLS